MRFYFPPSAVFLLLLGVWPSFHRSHEIHPTSRTEKIQTGPAGGPLVTEERPLQVEHYRYQLRVGFPLKPAVNAEYSEVLEKIVTKKFPSSVPTTTSTSFIVFPNPLGVLFTALCLIGSATIFMRHRRGLRKT
jgi:hypothetical protein